MRRLKSGDIAEVSIHTTVLEWASVDPLIKPYRRFILHYPNESKRTPRYGKLLKRMGMRKGVSDLFIAVPRHGYGGAWIELKSTKGVLSREQKAFLEDMNSQNYYTSVCWSIEETIKTIGWYLDVKTS